MANAQTTQFGGFAGQLVASGIDTNMPVVALEQSVDKTVFANLSAINGLMPKIKDIFIHETKIFSNPLEPYITRYDERYGAGLEQAAFMTGAYNEEHDGTCVPMGTPSMASQIDLVNFAYSADVDVKDREIDKAVLDEGQVGAYVANKMRTPLKTIASMKYRAWVQLISDVVDGERSINSKNAYNGSSAPGAASSVTYAPEIVGYAGKVVKRSEVIPMTDVGTKAAINTPLEALNICNELKAAAADMAFESAEYNKLGIHTFTSGQPILIAEKKVLDAMDTVFAEYNAQGNANGNYGYAGFPTVSAREYIRQFVRAIVELDSFAPLPDNTGASYEFKTAGYALHFVLMDGDDSLIEVVKWGDSESQRCAKKRLTGTNWAGESIYSIWRGANAYAMLFKMKGSLTTSFSHATVAAGTTSVTSGTPLDVAPGTVIAITPADGYSVTGVTVNGVSLGAVTEFAMPQSDATVVITTAS